MAEKEVKNPETRDMTTPGGCCKEIEITSTTGESIDSKIQGRYKFEGPYTSPEGTRPYYKRVQNSWDAMYLFYHENRWVAESVLGATTHSSGSQLHGWIRYEGTFICPEDVGNQWRYWSTSSGSQPAGNKISVNAVGCKYMLLYVHKVLVKVFCHTVIWASKPTHTDSKHISEF